ncbi:hypothetical protein EDC01DRAFT_703313, partial [Geopyxis carbonaria]
MAPDDPQRAPDDSDAPDRASTSSPDSTRAPDARDPHRAQPATSLAALPYDLLHAIVAHLPTARALAALSRTCRALHTFVATSGRGWQIFVQAQFPSAASRVDWRAHAAHLTQLSLSYDRRGFLAQRVDPDIYIPGPATPPFSPQRRHRAHYAAPALHRWSDTTRSSQTVGFHPVLDAHTPAGAGTGETLVMGAGPDLLVRRRDARSERWALLREAPAGVAGKDDITALRLTDAGARALVGRANGALETVDLLAEGRWRVGARMHTAGRAVKCVALCEESRTAAAVLANEAVALFPLSGGAPAATLELPAAEQPWTAAFLSPGLLAVGKTATAPLSIHAITPTHISPTPLRAFAAPDETQVSSVFPIAALPSIRGPSAELFLAGWYHGATLLHDLRSPAAHVAAFVDPLDPTSAVYSLLPLGRERLVVGGARHNLLKVFDLRMTGGRVYSSPSLPSLPPLPSLPSLPATTTGTATGTGASAAQHGWATYLTQHHSAPRREKESPVYALAASHCGARLFAGVEGRVWEFDFAGDAAQHHFPAHPRRRSGSVEARRGMGAAGPAGGENGRRAWNSRSCSMYEFTGRTRLWRQGPEGLMGHPGEEGGRLDARW